MNIVDIIILFILFIGIVSGYHEGFFKKTVELIGFIIALILAFTFKNNLSVILYEKLPFINFDFIFKGVTVFNILAYELIAFLLILVIVLFIIRLIKIITGLVDKVLSFSILQPLSKFLGLVVGFIKSFLIIFVVLFILTLFNLNIINNSKLSNLIIYNTPYLSNIIKDNIEVIDDFYKLKESYNEDNIDEFNYKSLDLFLNKKIITIDSVKILQEKNKLKFDGIDELIERYDIND